MLKMIFLYNFQIRIYIDMMWGGCVRMLLYISLNVRCINAWQDIYLKPTLLCRLHCRHRRRRRRCRSIVIIFMMITFDLKFFIKHFSFVICCRDASFPINELMTSFYFDILALDTRF